MCGLESFLKRGSDGETPRVQPRGNFCLLAENEEKNSEKNKKLSDEKDKELSDPNDIPLDDMTTRTVVSNMARGGGDSNLWEFLCELQDVARSCGNPEVKVLKAEQAWGLACWRDNNQGANDFRVKIVFS